MPVCAYTFYINIIYIYMVPPASVFSLLGFCVKIRGVPYVYLIHTHAYMALVF